LVAYQIPDNRIARSVMAAVCQLLLVARSFGLDVHFDD